MRKIVLLTLTLLVTTLVFAQDVSPVKQIRNIALSARARIGVSAIGPSGRDTLSFRGDEKFPMQSVFKFHIGLYVLHLVDVGKLSLAQQIHIDTTDYEKNTWSPIAKKYPQGNVNLSLEEILGFTVSESDNNGCDILLKLVGGPKAVQNYFKELGLTAVAIANTEREMHADWDAQYRNWTTPKAATQLLKAFDEGRIVKSESRDVMMRFLTKTVISDRINGLLPKGTVVAHKTGTSGTRYGITPATNDIGIVLLPDGRHYYIAVFVSDSWETDKKNSKLIAEISKTVWERYRVREKI